MEQLNLGFPTCLGLSYLIYSFIHSLYTDSLNIPIKEATRTRWPSSMVFVI